MSSAVASLGAVLGAVAVGDGAVLRCGLCRRARHAEKGRLIPSKKLEMGVECQEFKSLHVCLSITPCVDK